ncbi:MAG: hypothetical protein ACI8RD_004596 [Bacillariaceae sp.]|jgi:hypothetical protein
MIDLYYAASSILATIFLVGLTGLGGGPSITGVNGERSTVSANQLSKYWIDARDVLEDLDQYQALWIKIHGCV